MASDSDDGRLIEAVEDPNYDDSNRAFLQALFAAGSLTFSQAKPILASILSARNRSVVSPESIALQIFEAYVQAAAQAVSPFDYEVRHSVHQVTRETVYAVVNTTSDPATTLATSFQPDEISFIKRVLDAMFDTCNTPRMEVMCLTEMQAFKLRRPNGARRSAGNAEGGGNRTGNGARDRDRDDDNGDLDGEDAEGTRGGNNNGPSTRVALDKGLKTSEVEKVFANLVAEGWLERSRHEFYSLTPRALMELRTYLLDAYNDPDAGPEEWQRIKTCVACKELLTVGQRCAERDCLVRLHDICEGAFWRSREKKCPKCARDWEGKHFVGERAVTTTDAYQRAHRKGGVRSRSLVVDDLMREEEPEGEGDEDDEMEA